MTTERVTELAQRLAGLPEPKQGELLAILTMLLEFAERSSPPAARYREQIPADRVQ